MGFGILFFFMFIAIAALIVAAKTIKIVPQSTVLLVERLGRFNRLASSGLNVLVPFLDKPREFLKCHAPACFVVGWCHAGRQVVVCTEDIGAAVRLRKDERDRHLAAHFGIGCRVREH